MNLSPALQQLQKLQSLAALGVTAGGAATTSAATNPLVAQQELYKLNQTLLSQLSAFPGAFYPAAAAAAAAAAATIPTSLGSPQPPPPVPNYMFANPNATGYGGPLGSPAPGSKPPSADSSSKNSPTATTSAGGRLMGGGGSFMSDMVSAGQRSNRPSYASSTSTLFDELRLARSLEKGMESLRLDDGDGVSGTMMASGSGSSSSSPFIKPLSQVGTLTTIDTDGKVKVIVPMSDTQQKLDIPAASVPSRKSASFSELPTTNTATSSSTGSSTTGTGTGTTGGSSSASGSGTLSQGEAGSTRNVSILKDSTRFLHQPQQQQQQHYDKKTSIPSLVTLKVTDESGTVTRKLPATPSFITRSTSEKVPNRSQIMSQVQRSQWARHTTK
ncbi:putative protein TPRXL [Anopheles darlingi]|uniref:putative protein TPRXL n=1 Tax=Anopheles darlingi TaxID=43151 RepID=UPI0020FFFB4F|nr:putative protein TPRXL [Anopheles darlingi]